MNFSKNYLEKGLFRYFEIEEMPDKLKIGIKEGIGRAIDYLYLSIMVTQRHPICPDIIEHVEVSFNKIFQNSIRLTRICYFRDNAKESTWSAIKLIKDIKELQMNLSSWGSNVDFYFKLSTRFENDAYFLDFELTDNPFSSFEMEYSLSNIMREITSFLQNKLELIEMENSEMKSQGLLREAKIEREKGIRQKELVSSINPVFQGQEIEEIDTEGITNRYLYLMKDESDSGAYKIGISNNPKFRESTLQREKPSIKLVGKWAELSGFEKKWHSHFSENRMRGEWFKLSKYQVKLFCSMCSKPLCELQKFFSKC